VDADKPDKKKFKAHPIGYFHIGFTGVQTAEGKLYCYAAIDRTWNERSQREADRPGSEVACCSGRFSASLAGPRLIRRFVEAAEAELLRALRGKWEVARNQPNKIADFKTRGHRDNLIKPTEKAALLICGVGKDQNYGEAPGWNKDNPFVE
jgi:hypothetical protein